MSPFRFFAAIWIFALASCAPMSSAWMTGWTASAARDRIMLVREEPPTLGFRRLSYHSDIYPDLHEFLVFHGKPDFLGETTGGGFRYLLFYYLGSGQSFVLRTPGSGAGTVTCAGPYPMSRRERAKLGDLRAKAMPGENPGT
jgi:hypothetical protein